MTTDREAVRYLIAFLVAYFAGFGVGLALELPFIWPVALGGIATIPFQIKALRS